MYHILSLYKEYGTMIYLGPYTVSPARLSRLNCAQATTTAVAQAAVLQ